MRQDRDEDEREVTEDEAEVAVTRLERGAHHRDPSGVVLFGGFSVQLCFLFLQSFG